MPYKDPAVRKEYLRRWCAAHTEQVAGYQRTPEARAVRRAYREANRARIAEERKEYDRARYASRRDEVLHHQRSPEGREIRQAWERTNRGHQNQKSVEWRAANRFKARMIVRASLHKRRAVMRAAPGRATTVQLMARVEYYGHRCAYCSGPFEALDHVIPISRGGSNWPANFRPACKSCNSRKSNMPLAEFLRRRSVVQQAA